MGYIITFLYILRKYKYYLYFLLLLLLLLYYVYYYIIIGVFISFKY